MAQGKDAHVQASTTKSSNRNCSELSSALLPSFLVYPVGPYPTWWRTRDGSRQREEGNSGRLGEGSGACHLLPAEALSVHCQGSFVDTGSTGQLQKVGPKAMIDAKQPEWWRWTASYTRSGRALSTEALRHLSGQPPKPPLQSRCTKFMFRAGLVLK